VEDVNLHIISEQNVLTVIQTVGNGLEVENALRILTGWLRIVVSPATSAQSQEPRLVVEELHNNNVKDQPQPLFVLQNVNLPDALTKTSAVNTGVSKANVLEMLLGWLVIAESLADIVSLKTISMELAMTTIEIVLLGLKEESAKRILGCWRTASCLVRPV